MQIILFRIDRKIMSGYSFISKVINNDIYYVANVLDYITAVYLHDSYNINTILY